MNLYIVRHAWAEERDGGQWPDDDLRPLTAVGAERFAQVVKQLARRGVTPGVIGASPLTRCVETARMLAAGLADRPKVVELEELRPAGDVTALLRWTIRQTEKHDEIAWVGHAPDVGRLTAALIGERDGLIHFAKGAVAAVRFDGPPALGCGELQWLVTAKLLGI
jgi:phosphohistidine phosphatase SixA